MTLAAAALAFLAGAALQLHQPDVLGFSAGWTVSTFAAMLAAGWVLIRRGTGHRAPGAAAASGPSQGRRPGRRPWALGLGVAFALAAGALGTVWTDRLAQQRLAQGLDPVWEGVDLWITGTVAELPVVGPEGVRFVFEVEAVQPMIAGPAPDRERFPRRLWLGWWSGWSDDGLTTSAVPVLRVGQQWRLPVRLKQAHGLLNPQGFDAELWLFERHLRATGSVRVVDGVSAQRLGQEPAWRRPFESVRQRVVDGVQRQVGDARRAGIVAALAVGDQAAVDRADWAVLRDSGVAHLMSISGLHVTLFAWVVGGGVGALWRRAGRAPLILPAPTAARCGGLLAALAYAALAGWGVPAQRTVWMLAVATAVALLGLRWPPLFVLLLAAVTVTALDPWALLQVGFWLSFAAVGLLMVAGGGRGTSGPRAGVPGAAPSTPVPTTPGWLAAVRQGLHGQWVATVGLTPLTLICFQQVSVVGFVANLVAIPVVTGIVTPLALLGALWPPLWSLAAWVLEPLMRWLSTLAALPIAVWTAPVAPVAVQALALGGTVLVLWPGPAFDVRRGLRVAAGLMLVLPLLAWPPARPAPGELVLTALDVGQGSAVLVQTHRHLWVYDAGPTLGRAADAGERVVVPLLRALGHRRIDRLTLSHGDADHVGGAASLLAALPVSQLHGAPMAGPAVGAAPVPQEPCRAGQHWAWDGVGFEVLHPGAAEGSEPAADRNASSCVVRVVDARGRSVLLTGDIGVAEERALLHAGVLGPSQVLLVPHHGSRSSSSAAFIEAVQPRWAVMQLGYRNRYGHPAPEVQARYEAAGAAVVRTDRCGAWVWDGEASRCERQTRRRYWHARQPPAPVPAALP